MDVIITHIQTKNKKNVEKIKYIKLFFLCSAHIIEYNKYETIIISIICSSLKIYF